MDRVELGIRLEQMGRLRDKGEFEEAAKVADTIEWRKIKKWSELSFAADVYESADRLKDARNICVYAYNRNLGGKRLIYRLAELSVKIDDLDEAEELYQEFVEEAPKDTSRFILLYKISIAREASTDKLIEILEEYKQNELEEQYEYELAVLYAKAGRIEECIRECDDLILWFNEGEYVEKALILKSNYVSLTETQQKKFYEMQRKKAEELAKAQEEAEKETVSELEESSAEDETPLQEEPKREEIKIPVNNYSIYDTQNLQAEIAKSMSIILDGMAKNKQSLNYEPVVENLDDALPNSVQLQEEEKVSEPTKEIRLNAHYWNKNVSEPNNQSEEIDNTTDESDDMIEGQIGIMDWLNSVSNDDSENALEETADIMEVVSGIAAAFENNTATTMEKEAEEPKVVPEPEVVLETKSEEDILEEERIVDELTRKLIEEVQADLRERAVTVAPDEHPEEEYVSVNDSGMSEEMTTEQMDETFEQSETEELETEAEGQVEIPAQVFEKQEEPVETEDENETSETTQDKLSAEEKKYVRKYLGIEGMETALVKTIRGKKSELRDGTSAYGNIVVTGKADTDRSGFAINLFKALHAGENTKQLKIAKTTSAALNKKGILSSANKVKGTTLIIENAGTMLPETVKELIGFMTGQTESMLVIITGEDYSIIKLFRDFPAFAELFSYTLELKNMSVNDLVSVAKEYANEKGYAIDENALLKVYMLIDGLQMTSQGSEIQEVKKLVDEAIERCDNSKWPFGRKYKGLILLKEKHFS